MRLLVRAERMGYYGHRRRRPGVKFYLGGDALKMKKVYDKEKNKFVVMDEVVLPEWVKPLEKYTQAQLKKSLKEFEDTQKKKGAVVDEDADLPEDAEVPDRSQEREGSQGSPAEQEVI